MSSAEDRRAEREAAAAERKVAREKAAAERKAARASSSVAPSSEGGREKAGARERPTAARERPAAREKAAPVKRGSAVGQSASSLSANKQRKAEKATAKQQEVAKRDAYHDSMRAIDGKDKAVGEGGVALAPTTPAESASQRMKRLIDEERLQQIAARRRAATEESSFIQRQMARSRESDLRSQYEQMRPFQLRKLCAEQGVNAAADADKNTLTDLLVQAALASLHNDTPERRQAVEQTPEILAGSKAQPDFAEQAPVRPESR
jgi:hypothetical protein